MYVYYFCDKTRIGADEMSPWVTLATKPADLNSIPGTQVVGEN